MFISNFFIGIFTTQLSICTVATPKAVLVMATVFLCWRFRQIAHDEIKDTYCVWWLIGFRSIWVFIVRILRINIIITEHQVVLTIYQHSFFTALLLSVANFTFEQTIQVDFTTFVVTFTMDFTINWNNRDLFLDILRCDPSSVITNNFSFNSVKL